VGESCLAEAWRSGWGGLATGWDGWVGFWGVVGALVGVGLAWLLTSLWVSVSAKCEKKKVKWDRDICVCVCDRL